MIKQRQNDWSQMNDYKEELAECSEAELSDRFSGLIDFGTGGMRALMEAGTNRMNRHTVRLATIGLAKQILHDDVQAARVVISYDTRHQSREFAEEAAAALRHYGVEALVYAEARPTPMLSYAVRYYEAAAGIMITASHNPKEYNGYKLYGADGGQLTPEAVAFIRGVMEELVDEIIRLPIEKGSGPTYILEEIEASYQKELAVLKTDLQKRDLKIVYTPLHGTGLVPIKKALANFGYEDVFIEEKQALQDGNFPTVEIPNPEEQAAFVLAEKLGTEQAADILIATDPDADRLGVAILHDGDYEYLTGNQLGALLLYYKLKTLKESGQLPEHGVAIKTIVTSELGRAIAEHFGVEMEDTLTGFKYISEKIEAYNHSKERTFLFGYEESYGYLLEDFSRDKDAVQAAVAACELTQIYKAEGKTLVDVLHHLYEKFGYYKEALISIELDPLTGAEEVERLMTIFKEPTAELKSSLRVEAIENYEEGLRVQEDGRTETLSLPKENVVKYVLKDDHWICFRPSGTEPKMKVYVGVKASSSEQADDALKKLHSVVQSVLDE